MKTLKTAEAGRASGGKRLSVDQRRDIFFALVTAQDETPGDLRGSKQHVIEKFEISSEQLEEIVDEGIEKEWPPL
ncbi:MAG TPA: hypothetical protein PKD86_10970 [Gemmatales bacterium]|nr:hypothetical protein [Gemmatales bacterium]HMP59866.1 hypothetical protein [Gemmatales bacterium]